MDALKIEKATLAGFDWGARSANIVAALWPERCKALVTVSGYAVPNREANKGPLPPAAELQWWYQYYFATERGRAGYDKYRRDFAKLIWLNRVAEVEIRRRHIRPQRRRLRQSGSCRHCDPQLSLAAFAGRRRVEVRRSGKEDRRRPRSSPCQPSPWRGTPTALRTFRTTRTYRKKFAGKYEYRIIKGGIGHNLRQEAPHEFAQAVVDAARL